ncbi:MAG: glycerate kinase [Fimbriimonadales bacterium]|nr:glycerate kinase [Fimbriimonadales bacterium]
MIVLAFDKFKGTLTARQACEAAARGLLEAGVPNEAIDRCPLSDGGDGFLDCLEAAGAGERRWHPGATGPDFVPRRVPFLARGRTAFVESAKVCGLELLPIGRRDPLRTTSFGLGELLRTLRDDGFEEVVLGLGGTATCDGGVGMLAALGWRFGNAEGKPIHPVGGQLAEIREVRPGPPLGLRVLAATDVWNPLFGPNGAAHAFAPQKGADPAGVRLLDRGLRHLARLLAQESAHDRAATPGAGAAGGLGYAVLQALGGGIESGALMALRASRFEQRLARAALCITGEGKADAQTLQGKLPFEALQACRRARVRCVLLAGRLELDPLRAGFDDGLAAAQGDAPASEGDVARAAAELLRRSGLRPGA